VSRFNPTPSTVETNPSAREWRFVVRIRNHLANRRPRQNIYVPSDPRIVSGVPVRIWWTWPPPSSPGPCHGGGGGGHCHAKTERSLPPLPWTAD